MQIFSTEGAFAALKEDGSVVLGVLQLGGDSRSVSTDLQPVYNFPPKMPSRRSKKTAPLLRGVILNTEVTAVPLARICNPVYYNFSPPKMPSRRSKTTAPLLRGVVLNTEVTAVPLARICNPVSRNFSLMEEVFSRH